MEFIDELYPNKGKLQVENEVIKSQIIDAELDPIDLVFNNDNCVAIDTSKLSYISLSIENLVELSKLIKESNLKYKEMLKK